MVTSTGGATASQRRARTSSKPISDRSGASARAASAITSSSMVMGTTGNRSACEGHPSGWR